MIVGRSVSTCVVFAVLSSVVAAGSALPEAHEKVVHPRGAYGQQLAPPELERQNAQLDPTITESQREIQQLNSQKQSGEEQKEVSAEAMHDVPQGSTAEWVKKTFNGNFRVAGKKQYIVDFDDVLGSGAFSQVVRGRMLPEDVGCAIKVMNCQEDWEHEVMFLKALQNADKVVRMYDSLAVRSWNGPAYMIVMELLDEDLFNYICVRCTRWFVGKLKTDIETEILINIKNLNISDKQCFKIYFQLSGICISARTNNSASPKCSTFSTRL